MEITKPIEQMIISIGGCDIAFIDGTADFIVDEDGAACVGLTINRSHDLDHDDDAKQSVRIDPDNNSEFLAELAEKALEMCGVEVEEEYNDEFGYVDPNDEHCLGAFECGVGGFGSYA